MMRGRQLVVIVLALLLAACSPLLTPTPTPWRAGPSTTPTARALRLVAVPQTIAINAGGDAYQDYAADRAYSPGGFGYVGGQTYSTQTLITPDGPLYQTERYSMDAYRFDVPNGEYTLQLHFAEIYYTSPGARVFDVSVNGAMVLPALDIVLAAGGAFRPYSVTLPVNVTAGSVEVTFGRRQGNPKISALSLTQKAQPTATPSVTPTSVPEPSEVERRIAALETQAAALDKLISDVEDVLAAYGTPTAGAK